MAKKCSSCGFSDNPDNANFCGKCGNKFSLFENWKLYNARQYCLVELYEYIEYKELKAKYERTFFQRVLDWFSANWRILKGIGYSILFLFFLCFLILLIYKQYPWYNNLNVCLGFATVIIAMGCGAYSSFKNKDW